MPFLIKHQEMTDKSTGINIATGAHAGSSGTQWMRVTDREGKSSTFYFNDVGDVLRISPTSPGDPVEEAPPALPESEAKEEWKPFPEGGAEPLRDPYTRFANDRYTG